MAATNYMSLLPGRNPAGTMLASDYSISPDTGTTSGANPLLPPPNIPAGSPGSNPYNSSVVPTFGANTGGGYSTTNLAAPTTGAQTPNAAAGSSPIGGMNMMTQKDLTSMFNNLKSTYGDGVAHSIMDFLSSGAGFNQAAINNLFAAMQPGIERGTESLMEQFSTSGNRFGSGAQIGLADYLSQVNLNQGQLETQMYEQSINNYINTLLSVSDKNASRIASSPSTFDNIISGLNLGAAGAGAASAAGVGGTAGSILDTIASLGGVL